jgi:TorA maturation chaperone TorD
MTTTQSKMKDMARLGSQRSYIYGFLATVYRKELTPELLDQLRDSQFLEALVGIGIHLGEGFSTFPAKTLLENLEVEYTRLFLGPGGQISPHESVHFARRDATVEVRRLIESLGLEFKEDANSIPDHISIEMELMQKITARESRAWTEEDKAGALRCLNVEKKFIEDHLWKWIPRFYEEVAVQAEIQSYKEISKLTMDFIEFEKENMDSYVNSVKAVKV